MSLVPVRKRRKMQVEVRTVEVQTDSDYEIYDRDLEDMYGPPCDWEPTPEEKARMKRREECMSYVSGKGHNSYLQPCHEFLAPLSHQTLYGVPY